MASSLPFPFALRRLANRPEVSQPSGREYILTGRPTSKSDPPLPRIEERSLEDLEPGLLPLTGRGLIAAPYPRPRATASAALVRAGEGVSVGGTGRDIRTQSPEKQPNFAKSPTLTNALASSSSCSFGLGCNRPDGIGRVKGCVVNSLLVLVGAGEARVFGEW